MQSEETSSQDYPRLLSLSPYSESSYVMKHQDLINRHALCLTRLREAATELESLREENVRLRRVNLDLKEQMSYIMNSNNTVEESDTRAIEIVSNELHKLSCGGEEESPTSVIIEKRRSEEEEDERNWLPKSISVRSNAYFKPPPPTKTPIISTPKVYVKGGKKEEEGMEVEVYKQGMLKTELCNKWQLTGSCPYANHCQFAHGIHQLRPVIRHPRYKTEVCRMVLAGDACPYGHRCHFRHALTHQEKLIANLTSPTTLHT